MQENISDQPNNSYQVNGETYQVHYIPPQKSGCGGSSCLMGCGVGCLVLIIILAVGGFIFYAYCVKGVPMQISPETTVISSPLKSDGKSVDFFTAIKEKIEPKDVANNNGFKDVLEAYGKELIINNKQNEFNNDWIFSEMCKSVELDPNFTPAHIYKEPNFYEIKIAKKEKNNDNENEKNEEVDATQDNEYGWQELVIYKNVLSEKWNIKEYPELEEWLESVNSGLDVVQKAAMKEIYVVPMVRRSEKELAIMSITPQVIVANRQLAHGLEVRSILHTGNKEFDKAWKDLLASIHLRRNLINKGIYIFDKIDPITDQLKLQLIKTFAESSSKWKPEQLNKAITELDSIPQSTKREDLLLITQYIFLDVFSLAGDPKQFVESISGQSLGTATNEGLQNMVYLLELFGFNWNIVAKKLNESTAIHKKTITDENTEQILNTTNNTTLEIDGFTKNLTEKMQQKMSNVFTVAGRSEMLGFIVGEFVPALEKHIFKQVLNDEVRCRLLQTAFAIELYKSENKKYPESLDQLKLNPPKMPALKTNYKITDKGYKISIGDIELEITPNTN